jgi:hypothetical protein
MIYYYFNFTKILYINLNNNDIIIILTLQKYYI